MKFTRLLVIGCILLPLRGAGLVTAEEIMTFLTLPPDQVCRKVQDEIKSRGAGFEFKYGTGYAQALTRAGCLSAPWDVITAVKLNQGPPAPLSWWTGRWNIAQSGFIEITSNGTYIWKIHAGDPPSAYRKSSWRLATAAEMGLQGGAAIVLLRGEADADWIVFKRSGNQEMVDIQHLQARGGVRRLGSRISQGTH